MIDHETQQKPIEKTRSGFAAIGNWYVDDGYTNLGLGPTAIYWYLCIRAGTSSECWPSLGTMADEFDISKPTVRKHLTVLENSGLISIEHRTNPNGEPTTNRYVINARTIQTGGVNPNGSKNFLPPSKNSLPKQYTTNNTEDSVTIVTGETPDATNEETNKTVTCVTLPLDDVEPEANEHLPSLMSMNPDVIPDDAFMPFDIWEIYLNHIGKSYNDNDAKTEQPKNLGAIKRVLKKYDCGNIIRTMQHLSTHRKQPWDLTTVAYQIGTLVLNGYENNQQTAQPVGAGAIPRGRFGDRSGQNGTVADGGRYSDLRPAVETIEADTSEIDVEGAIERLTRRIGNTARK